MGGEGQAVQGSFQKRQAQRNSQGSTVHQREPFSRPAVGWMSHIQEKRGERAGGSRLWDRASAGGREPGHSTVGAPSKPLSQRPTQADSALQNLLGGQVRGAGNAWRQSGSFLQWRGWEVDPNLLRGVQSNLKVGNRGWGVWNLWNEA